MNKTTEFLQNDLATLNELNIDKNRKKCGQS